MSLVTREFDAEQDRLENEKLTFGELLVGELFIALPIPGDNMGHGGFKDKHFIFKKHSNSEAFRYEVGGEISGILGNSSKFPSSMPVINVG